MTKAAAIRAVKGFRDVLPDESRRWQAIEDAAVATFVRYGFGEIRLPILERTELFARSLGESTDVVEKEMYTFVDRDETSVTLRPEATASVVRAYLESGLAQSDPTAQLFYRGPMFRRERPQKGRYRQFYQIGAEVLGREDALADAELLVMLARLLETVQARGVRLELNSVGDAACRPTYTETLRAFGRAHLAQLCGDCHRRLERNPLRLFDCKVETCRAVLADAPMIVDALCDPCRTHLAQVRALLDVCGVAYGMNPRLVRGLDYYVRTAFEFVSDAMQEGGNAQQATLFGGGRYDGMAELLGGPHVPGVGFGMGLERVLIALQDEGVASPNEPPLDVYVVALTDPARVVATGLVRELREAGLAADLPYEERPLKAQLKMADRAAARFAAIIGDDELAAGSVTLRRLADGEQTEVPRAEVAASVERADA
jgi:histidyl-tRNA synthetase